MELRDYLVGLGLAPRTVELTVDSVERAQRRVPSAPEEILLDEELSAGTRQIYAKALLHLARFQKDGDLEAWIKDNWPRGPKRKRKVSALKVRSEWPEVLSEIDTLRDGDPLYWACLRLMADVGLRIGDLLEVTKEQLDEALEEGEAVVKQKAGADRYLVVTEETWEPISVLAEDMEPGDKVLFVLGTDRRRTRKGIEARLRQLLGEAGERAGVRRRVTPHTLRRTLIHAVRIVTGGDRIAARDAAGHASARTTDEWYLDDAEPEELQRNLGAVARLRRPQQEE